MARIQLAYTHLPKWLQSGVTSYNKSSIELENGCKVVAAATSSDAVRGRSFACVTGDTIINVKRNNIELQIKIEDVENTDLVLTQSGYKKFECVRITPKKNKIKLSFSNGDELKCTKDHKLLTTNNIFVEAQSLKVGDFIKNYDTFVRITSILYYEDYELVYDLVNVEDTHAYYTNGVLSHNCVFIDETAWISKTVWDKFWTSTFPTISSGKNSKLILVSTPNGRDHFYDFWKNAIDGKSDMYPMEVNWWDVPGRDEEWRKNILKNITQEQFNVEYGNSFDASSDTLISPDMFGRLERNVQQPEHATKVMRIYEPPQEGRQYLATVDCADVGADFSTISVIDITEYPWKQVAVFGDDSISHLSLPQIIVNVCTKYNNADVLVESNEIGNTVLYILNYDKEYENIIRTFDKTGRALLGQKTTSKTKSVGCARFKDMVESEKLIIRDHKTFGELRHFCLSGTSYEAEQGFHDDYVMGLVNLAYYASTPQFKSKYESNFSDEFQREYDEKIMEELMPLPLFSSRMGIDSEDLSWLQQL